MPSVQASLKAALRTLCHRCCTARTNLAWHLQSITQLPDALIPRRPSMHESGRYKGINYTAWRPQAVAHLSGGVEQTCCHQMAIVPVT